MTPSSPCSTPAAAALAHDAVLAVLHPSRGRPSLSLACPRRGTAGIFFYYACPTYADGKAVGIGAASTVGRRGPHLTYADDLYADGPFLAVGADYADGFNLCRRPDGLCLRAPTPTTLCRQRSSCFL